MNTRKTVLLAGIAILAGVCALQAALAGRGSIEILKLKAGDAPDAISISRADGSVVTLGKSSSGWTVGDKKYPADPASVDEMLAAVSSVKILGTVSGSSDYERYGLGEGSRVTVTASKAGKTLRTLAAGKSSVTATQSYALVDGKKNVVLVSGSLRELFDRGVDAFRSHAIWSVAADGIAKVEATASGRNASFAISKTGKNAAWQLSAPDAAKSFLLSSDKANAWAASFAAVRADSFAPDGTAISDKPLVVFKITAAGKEITFAVVSKLEGQNAKTGEPSGGKYLCTSSESPYPFYIPESTGAKMLESYTSLGK
jgi:hypothetical protein